MAKISARGATKIAQHSIEWHDSDGWDHKLRLALRSDGRVLRAHDLRSPDRRENYGSRGWNRSGYSIVPGVRANAATFTNFAAGYFRAMHPNLRNARIVNNTTAD